MQSHDHDGHEIKVLRERVKVLEETNRELVHFAIATRALRDIAVKMLTHAIEEGNHWKRKARGQ